ncbi:MAG TPA: hypothetical protein VF991_00400, partial [Reyranella sp.]
RIWNVANETRDEALALLSPDEAEILIDLLCRVHTTLSDRVPFGGRPAILAQTRASAATAVPEATTAGKMPAVETAR